MQKYTPNNVIKLRGIRYSKEDIRQILTILEYKDDDTFTTNSHYDVKPNELDSLSTSDLAGIRLQNNGVSVRFPTFADVSIEYENDNDLQLGKSTKIASILRGRSHILLRMLLIDKVSPVVLYVLVVGMLMVCGFYFGKYDPLIEMGSFYSISVMALSYVLLSVIYVMISRNLPYEGGKCRKYIHNVPWKDVILIIFTAVITAVITKFLG